MNEPNGTGKTVAFCDIKSRVTEVSEDYCAQKERFKKHDKDTKRRETWKNIKSFGKHKRDEVKRFSLNFEYMDYSCLHNNLIFEDYKYFLRYVKGFKNAFTQERWEEYMNTKTYPVFYYKEPFPDSYNPEYRKEPHLNMVDICKIKGFYAYNDKNIFRNATTRVAYVIKQIINYDNAPIALFRCVDTGTYCLIDGRHRFQAYILLGKRKVFALVTDVSSKPLDGFYSDYEKSMIDTYRTLKQETKDKIDILMAELE